MMSTPATHWGIDMPGFSLILSRDKFMSVLQYLHLCSNEKAPRADDNNRGHMFKVRNLLNHIVSHWGDECLPSKSVSVDESTVAFRGRVDFWSL